MIGLYAAAFGLLVASGVAMAFAGSGLLASTKLLWTSTVLSGLAIGAAFAGIVTSRR